MPSIRPPSRHQAPGKQPSQDGAVNWRSRIALIATRYFAYQSFRRSFNSHRLYLLALIFGAVDQVMVIRTARLRAFFGNSR